MGQHETNPGSATGSEPGDAPDGLIEVGVILRGHGVRGHVILRPHNAESEIFTVGRPLVIRREGDPDRRYSIRSADPGSSPNKGGIRVGFAELRDRTEADALRGATVWVPVSALPELEDDEFYHFELMDLEVEALGVGVIGRISEVMEGPAHDIYGVTLEGGPHPGLEALFEAGEGELLIPAVERYVSRIDLAAGKVVVQRVDELV